MRSVLEEEEEEEVKLSELTFADDVALVTNNTKEAQIILAVIEKYAAEENVSIVFYMKKS
jgi:hypothetical protein